MKLYLIKLIIIYAFLFFNTSLASDFEVNYNVSTSGIKIGEFNWFLNLNENLEWLDDHIATFVFRNAGEIDLDFEVEQ